MRAPVLTGLLIAIGLLLALGVATTGPAGIGPTAWLDGLDASQSTILFKLRVPRILMALLAGSGLAVSGALMQTFFRNPLAEPYITGINSGGALGAVLIGTLGLTGAYAKGLGAILGGAAITLVLYLFALRRGGQSPVGVLLMGIALGTLCGALTWLLLIKQDPGSMTQNMAWLLGSVSTVGYGEILFLAPVTALGIGAALLYRRDLDALLLGEEKAASLGVNVLKARRGILGAAALLAAVSVAFCGVIAFVGLMVPHVLRGWVGALHHRLLPLCALGGAVLVLGVDLVSRLLDPPREIPLTIITSLIGAPFFIAVLVRSRGVRI